MSAHDSDAQLADFLVNRLAEAERVALRASDTVGRLPTTAVELGDMGIPPWIAEHILSNLPGAVLARIDATKAVVAAWHLLRDVATTDEEWAWLDGLAEAMGHLAAPWREHPDYRTEWTPR